MPDADRTFTSMQKSQLSTCHGTLSRWLLDAEAFTVERFLQRKRHKDREKAP
jgi:hypothetical protein